MATKGKYAHVIDKLPRHLGTEPKYQEKVEAVKTSIATIGLPPDPNLSENIYQNLQHAKDHFNIISGLLIMARGEQKYASTYAFIYTQIRKVKEEIEAHLSNINLIETAYVQLMEDQFEVEGTKSTTLDNGDVIRIQKEPYTSVVDKAAFRQWCIEQGLEEQLHLHPSTANSLCKERLVEGEPDPPGISFYAKSKVVYTPSKG